MDTALIAATPTGSTPMLAASGGTASSQSAAPDVATASGDVAGEAAAAFIAAVSQRGEGASVFNLNGQCETIEAAIDIIISLAPDADIRCEGTPFPFPPDLDEAPVRFQLPEYPAISVTDGITATFNAFSALHETGTL